MLSEIHQTHKCDLIFMGNLRESNKQRVEWQLQGTGGGEWGGVSQRHKTAVL